MDPSKKRRTDENGVGATGLPIDPAHLPTPQHTSSLSPEDARKIIESLTHDQLISILQDAVLRHPDILAAVRAVADRDPAKRKLFVRGIGWETTTESLRSLFSSYGEIDEAIVITDKNTGKSKGYGFVTFKHVDGAVLALKCPSKKIDGRMTVTQLASSGSSGGSAADDVAARKVYVGNIPFDISAERLLSFFSVYGEVEEGPLGFDKQAGKPKGFAFFVYRTEDGARVCLAEPTKVIDGHQVMCKLAVDGKKGKGNAAGESGGERMAPPTALPGSMNSSFGGSAYGGYGTGHHPQGPGIGGLGSHQGTGSVGAGLGFGSMGNQGPGGYAPASYPAAASQIGAHVSGDFGSYRMPPSYQESGSYAMGSSAYASQQHPPQGPPGGMYQRMPPYY